MLRRFAWPFAALLFLTAGAGAAETGSAGLVAVPLTVANAGAEAIGCRAAIAHWFSAEVGTAPPGGTVEATLWVDPATGAVFLINAAGDPMPVESLWCGVAGATWRTRSLVPLPRQAAAGDAVALTCRGSAGGGPLSCRQDRQGLDSGG